MSFAVSAIGEESYSEVFRQRVRPWFDDARRSGTLAAGDGRVLSWMSIEAEKERGAVVICPGWTEQAECYAELLYNLRESGYSFYILDHRGQGLSEGDLPSRELWYVESWRSLLSDLELFFERVVRQRPHEEIVLYGFSMGGAVATAFLGTHPGAADRLLLVAPMFRINVSPIPRFLLRAFVGVMLLLGRGRSYLPGHGPYRSRPFEGNPDRISSRVRYEALVRLNESDPSYMAGGASVKGGLELDRLSTAAERAASKVAVPTLLLQAGRDRMVRNGAQNRAARRMAQCRIVVVPDSGHVMLLETDRNRDPALGAIASFLGGVRR